jgi:peptidoglycan/xylan/chitin deacetylase (PgdA/CDA1 family)
MQYTASGDCATRTAERSRGVFTISLDFELIWGTFDLFGPERFRKVCAAERTVVLRLLELFCEFEVPATWCILGHLFLDRCAASSGRKHPEIVRPNHQWCPRDWFDHDPCSDEASAPTFFGRSLVEKIRDCPVPQEVGSHGFSHIVLGDPGCSPATAESEIAACVRLARETGLEVTTFAFPRNRIGHLDVLRRFGFECYRGPEPTWYEQSPHRGVLERLAHLWDVLTAATPPVVLPQRTSSGLWNIPGSMIYFPIHGFRRFVPVAWRVLRARRGLDAAARQKKIFHLWFHPTNLVDRTGAMLAGLRNILDHASALRASGQLDFLSMGSLVQRHGAALARP